MSIEKYACAENSSINGVMLDMTEKDQIIRLRQRGLSYRAIQKATGANPGKIAYHCSATVRDNRRQFKRNHIRSLKKQALEYKGGKCSHCSFNTFQSALDFHHLDPSFKEGGLARMFEKRLPFEIIQKELDKCVLVCSNCHRGIHSGDVILNN